MTSNLTAEQLATVATNELVALTSLAPELETRPSEFVVEVVRLGKIEPHPNSESTQLEVTVIHVPIDSMVDTRLPAFAFLRGEKGRDLERIKAKKLKGYFSMGLVIPIPEGWHVNEGDDVTERLQVTKYEPPALGGPTNNGDQVRVPQQIPVYGVEGYRKYGKAFAEQFNADGAPIEVVCTAKVDGQNFRACYLSASDTCIVGSHHTFRDPTFVGEKAYHTYVFQRAKLDEGLRRHPDVAIYGEVYGAVTGGAKALTYGVKAKNGVVGNDVKFIMFDALNIKTNQWLDYDDMVAVANDIGVDVAPILYRGPYDATLVKALADGPAHVGNHIREGVVIAATKERRLANGVRLKLKLVSEAYLLLK